MHLTFHGAARQIGGAAFLLHVGNKRLLIAAGQHAGGKAQTRRNNVPLPFDVQSLDAVIITDSRPHTAGLVPKLVRHGLRAPIFAAASVARWLPALWADLADSLHNDVARVNRHRIRQHLPHWQPIYTTAHAAQAATLLHIVPSGVPWAIDPYVQFTLAPMQHNPTAFNVSVRCTPPHAPRQHIVFGGSDALKPGSTVTEQSAETFVWQVRSDMEQPSTAAAVARRLARIIPRTFAQRGNVIIGVAPGPEAEVVLSALQHLIANNTLDSHSIVVDTAAAADITQRLPTSAARLNWRLALTPAHSAALNSTQAGLVVVTTAGMGESGRMKHHLRHNVWRPECTVCLTGLQLPGTLGHRLLSGANIVRIHGRPVAVAARTEHVTAAAQPGRIGHVQPPSTMKRMYLVDAAPETLRHLQHTIQGKIKAAVFVPRQDECVALTPTAVTSVVPGGQYDTVAATDDLWHAMHCLRASLDDLERRGIPGETMTALIDQLERVRHHALVSRR